MTPAAPATGLPTGNAYAPRTGWESAETTRHATMYVPPRHRLEELKRRRPSTARSSSLSPESTRGLRRRTPRLDPGPSRPLRYRGARRGPASGGAPLPRTGSRLDQARVSERRRRGDQRRNAHGHHGNAARATPLPRESRVMVVLSFLARSKQAARKEPPERLRARGDRRAARPVPEREHGNTRNKQIRVTGRRPWVPTSTRSARRPGEDTAERANDAKQQPREEIRRAAANGTCSSKPAANVGFETRRSTGTRRRAGVSRNAPGTRRSPAPAPRR